jgi:UDPglucose 6-dehydrogenase
MNILGKPQPDADVVNKEPNVLLIGYGWVGQYCGKYFTSASYVNSSGIITRQKTGESVLSDQFDLAIISVPTPMNPETGQCDTSIVEEVVRNYKSIAHYFLIKSTVEIGTTDRLAKKYNVKIAMSPEYIGETLGHPLLEPRRDAFQIFGGEDATVQAISGFWRTVLNANAPILFCKAIEAEIIKYCENMWITERVNYWNSVYEICSTLGAVFDRVREGLVLDPRFSRTHSNVYPNNRGWSGKCLPKDMNALAYKMRKAGKPLTHLENLIKLNANYWRKGYSNKERLLPEKPEWK